MEPLHIGDTMTGDPIILPPAAVTQKFAILAESGAGKTYTALRLAELFVLAGAQIVAIDPVGVWWSLRVGATGDGPGLPVYVFGGEHGDVPLPPDAGARIADVLIDLGIPAVLDVSDLVTSEQRRFVAAFAEQFFQRKKRAKSAVHLFLEEAQLLAPQDPEDREDRIMLNRVERLGRVGRNYGVGWTAISQRPQDVHKRLLNLATTLFALRTSGNHERRAVADWVLAKARKQVTADLLDMLPELETGTAHVWSPSFLKLAEVVRVTPRITFDASATPTLGDVAQQPRALAPVDVAMLQEALAVPSADPDSADVDALRKRIAELECQVNLTPVQSQPDTVTVVERVEVPIITEEQMQRWERAVADLRQVEQHVADVRAVADEIGGKLADVKGRVTQNVTVPVQSPEQPVAQEVDPVEPVAVAPPTTPKPKRPSRPKTAPTSANSVGSGARGMLVELALWSGQVTQAQWADLLGRSPAGGQWQQSLRDLKRQGLVRQIGTRFEITRAGLDVLDLAAAPPTRPAHALARSLQEGLDTSARTILDAIIAAHPDALPLPQLAKQTSIRGGTLAGALAKLRALGLVELGDGGFVATALLTQGASNE